MSPDPPYDHKETTPILVADQVTRVFGSQHARRDPVVAVDDVTIVFPGNEPKIVAVVGESGSGKTTLGLMILGLLQPTAGRVLFRGIPVVKHRREIQAVFQNPFESFNPFYIVDHTLDLAIKRHRLARGSGEAQDLKERTLLEVQLEPGMTLGRYPHQLSGGQLQRVMVARALMMKPAILVADEPVSMVDASLRTLVLRSLLLLKEEHGISQLFITHDLATAYQVSDEILVMHEGRVVERGDPASVIGSPQHQYTQTLVRAIPTGDATGGWGLR